MDPIEKCLKEIEESFERLRLHSAAADGDLARAKEIIESGYDVNRIDPELGWTPLVHAASAGHVEMVKYLLSVGADVNAHDESLISETALGHVAANCTYEMAKVLIEAGADPTIPGIMQCTALDTASKRKRGDGPRVYELLKKAANR